MSIANIAQKHASKNADPATRAKEETAAHATLTSAYRSAVKAYGSAAASAWITEKHGEPPTIAETQAAELAVSRENLAELRASNPFAAAWASKAHPDIAYAPGASATTTNEELRAAQRVPVEAPAPVSAAESFAASRARVAAAPAVQAAAAAAWIDATKAMTQTAGGRK
jgi:hypothetical protein